jgi:hypothetical protein
VFTREKTVTASKMRGGNRLRNTALPINGKVKRKIPRRKYGQTASIVLQKKYDYIMLSGVFEENYSSSVHNKADSCTNAQTVADSL